MESEKLKMVGILSFHKATCAKAKPNLPFTSSLPVAVAPNCQSSFAAEPISKMNFVCIDDSDCCCDSCKRKTKTETGRRTLSLRGMRPSLIASKLVRVNGLTFVKETHKRNRGVNEGKKDVCWRSRRRRHRLRSRKEVCLFSKLVVDAGHSEKKAWEHLKASEQLN